MMIEQLGAKNLKSSGRMMIEKVMIQIRAKCPKHSGGGWGGRQPPPTMIEKVMIQLGPKKYKKSSGRVISSSAARPHGASEDSITGKLIPVRHLKRSGGGGGGNSPNDAGKSDDSIKGAGGLGGEKMEKRGALGEGLLMVACSGFYVHLKSVFPLIRF